MGTERKLEEIATDLDDLSLTLEEIKQAVQDKSTTEQKTLAEVESHIERAADAIEEAVDPDPPKTKQ
jgi:DNA-binding transcriptional MerR regulator